jgi:GGDEF domain-containing protein
VDSPEYGEWRATHDPLTGLFNRNELERLRLEGPNEPLGVICFTLQDLGAWGGGKAIQGFEGDRELKDFANRLTLVALPGTFVVRLGIWVARIPRLWPASSRCPVLNTS